MQSKTSFSVKKHESANYRKLLVEFIVLILHYFQYLDASLKSTCSMCSTKSFPIRISNKYTELSYSSPNINLKPTIPVPHRSFHLSCTAQHVRDSLETCGQQHFPTSFLVNRAPNIFDIACLHRLGLVQVISS